MRIAPLSFSVMMAALLCLAVHAETGPPVSLDSKTIGQTPISNWTTFNGDYTGQRYSTLNEITADNVSKITQQWVYKITSVGAQRGAAEPVMKCTPLLVDGVLYITIPDHVWAIDAHNGKEIWHYDWVDHGGHLVGQRGVGIWKSSVFFLTPDNWLVALDTTSGKEFWRKNYADARKQYFSTSAPLIVKNHVIVGVGGDAMDMPGFLESFDPV
ncbi:MAG TPA: PQQ-binding-like beta-propeller repeat protein, partial [Acidobacteriaceae bacterium]|nr:PQQ-binding-like beta-propeller repeat protein [Acidobacteriaceae bacterium]